MNVNQGKNHTFRHRTTLRSVLTVFSLILAGPGLATAQNQPNTFIDYSHPNVTVDLSVLADGGYQQSAGPSGPIFGSAPGGRPLLVPSANAPVSMLHVPTVSGDPLPKPKKRKKVQTAAKAPMPAPAPAPAPVMKKAPEMESPPATAKIEPPKAAKVAEAPKKLEAPAKPATPVIVAKVEKQTPPPAPVVETAPKVVKKEAPKAPTPPPTPAAKKDPAPQQAALPPATAQLEPGNALRIPFAADQTKLPAAAKDGLVALADKMKGQDKARLQLMAYAGGESLSSSLARRMSLSRALAIRSFLIENGVRSTRIDVRALGNKTTEEPVNRVDLNVTER